MANLKYEEYIDGIHCILYETFGDLCVGIQKIGEEKAPRVTSASRNFMVYHYHSSLVGTGFRYYSENIRGTVGHSIEWGKQLLRLAAARTAKINNRSYNPSHLTCVCPALRRKLESYWIPPEIKT